MTSTFDDHNKQLIEKIFNICSKKSISICFVCILRFLNHRQIFNFENHEQLFSYYQNCLDEKFLDLVNKINDSYKLCQSCLNILNDNYIQEKSKEIGEYVSNKMSVIIKDFQLHISIPFILTLRHLYFSKLFDLNPVDIITVKDALKTFLTVCMEKILDSKNVTNSNHVIELNFIHEQCEIECESLMATYKEFFGQKKCKSLTSSSFINHTSLFRIFDQLNENILDRFDLIKIKNVCNLQISIYKEPLYIAGRYLKFSRNLSQTPWSLNDENHFISSVQERIVSGINKYIQFSDIKFSASGREDVDVRMLGKGRPFLIEILNPQWSISDGVIQQIKQFINKSYQDVNVRDLQFVPKSESQVLLKQGEQEKSKTYQAVCCLDRPFTSVDEKILNSIENLVICQKTPIRVLHRRTLMDRVRTIHKIWTRPINLDELPDPGLKPFIFQIFNMYIVTEAGTYIKEFVHSDFGRTIPNIAKLLGNCRADIINLDVLEVKLDWPITIDD